MLKKDISSVDQKGNVLWFILIAIALTAALTLTFTRSNKTSGKRLDENQAKIVALQVLNYAKDIKNAVEKLQIVNGCSESEVSFEHSFWGHTGYDITPTNTSCQVFHAAGGGQTPRTPPSQAGSEYLFLDRVIITDVDVSSPCWGQGNKPQCVDLIMTMRNVDESVCEAFNRMNGISPVAPMTDSLYNNIFGANDGYANGHFSNGNVVGSPSGGASNVDGKEYGCFTSVVTSYPNENIFYYVLIKR